MTLPVEVPALRLTTRLPESSLATLFDSPDFYPIRIDFVRRIVAFVRMSQETYRKSVFLDHRTQYLGGDVYGMRLDDLLFRSINVPMVSPSVHYILHPTFSCSTLLARYFELLPSCLVLKEPMALTQMAFVTPETVRDWDDIFQLTIRMLTRTYHQGEQVVIKGHEPSNALATKLLASSNSSSITFLITPLRQFIISVLKSSSRCGWVRTRIPASAIAAQCRALMDVGPDMLTDAQAATYLWLTNRSICKRLEAEEYRDRVLVLDANQLTDCPEEALKAVFRTCRRTISGPFLKTMLEHPTIHSYSKDLSRPYDSSVRSKELVDLEQRFGQEADAAINWAISCGFEEYIF